MKAMPALCWPVLLELGQGIQEDVKREEKKKRKIKEGKICWTENTEEKIPLTWVITGVYK